MMAHTPGPWHVREARWHEVAADAISDNGEEYELVIAQCDPAVQLLNNDSEIRANAALIAAAPDLLAALNTAVQAFNNLVEFGLLRGDEYEHETMLIIEKLEDVIKEATQP